MKLNKGSLTVIGTLLVIGWLGSLFNTNQPAAQISKLASQESSQEPTVEPTQTLDPVQTQEPEPTTKPAAEPTELQRLIEELPVAAEVIDGNDRELFRHWIDADGDGCNTRKEVLIAEAIIKPTVGSSCALSGGEWYSPYDNVTTNDPSDFDIDHFVPLNEAWQSGAYAWSSEKRKDFANDLGFDKSLIAVTASSNRSKSDRDPPNWIPRNYDYLCTYVRSWVEVKLRWGLTADQPEKDALLYYAEDCE